MTNFGFVNSVCQTFYVNNDDNIINNNYIIYKTPVIFSLELYLPNI